MKSSMMMAVAVCGVLAFAVSGCRYDDEGVNPDDLAVSTDVGTDGADVNEDGEVTIADNNAVIDIILGGGTPTPPTPDQDYVDLGLPSGTLWATHNIGANSPEEPGDYFFWGETEPKDYYYWSTYKWCNSAYDMTKYCTQSAFGTADNKTELDPEDDAAYVNWGSQWRMPTMEQLKELVEQCTWTHQTLNGMEGRLVTGPNGNSIFLPEAGYAYADWINSVGEIGCYWSRTLYPDSSSSAYCLHFMYDFGSPECSHVHRISAYPVRAVRVP